MINNTSSQVSLIEEAGVQKSLNQEVATEAAWIEVIHKMDSVYADLVHSQVELEQKNSALEEAQQFISSVLSAMTDVLIVCNTQSIILQVNTALMTLTGKSEDEFLQHFLSEIFGTDNQAMIDSFSEKLGHELLIDCEVSVLCADGSSTPLAMNCSTRYDANGTVIGMVLIGRPMGELRRAYKELHDAHIQLQRTQQQLLHSEKMASLGRLIAGVAHEINNPISFVFGNMHALKRYGSRINQYLDAVEMHIKSPELKHLRSELKIKRIREDMEPLIDGSMEGVERVTNIVHDLRNFSGGQKEEYTHFDLNEVIKKAVQWVLRTNKVNPEVQYELPCNLEIESCKGQIHQVLVNLIQNALDAMEINMNLINALPLLMLKCQVVDDIVHIHVLDHGSGISEQQAKNIFDPFFTSKPVGQGTGLGLYISYGIAQDMGGDLTFKNNPAGGTIFTLSLPLQRKNKVNK